MALIGAAILLGAPYAGFAVSELARKKVLRVLVWFHALD